LIDRDIKVDVFERVIFTVVKIELAQAEFDIGFHEALAG
jgi:hypothetical protein